MHIKIKCIIERGNITSYFLDLLKKIGKHDLTIGIYQQLNEADIIIQSAPIIERKIHKNQHEKPHPTRLKCLRNKQKTAAVLEIPHVKLEDRAVGITFGTKVEIPGIERL